jgi:hypothetical protein
LVDSAPEEMADAVISRLIAYPLANFSKLGRAVSVRFHRGARADDAFIRLPELERAIAAASLEGLRSQLPDLAIVEPNSEADHMPTVAIHGGLVVGSGNKPLIQLGRSVRGKLRHGQLDRPVPGVLFVRTRTLSFHGLDDLPTCLHAVAAMVGECFDGPASDVSAVIVYERWRGAPDACVNLVEQTHLVTIGPDQRGSNRFVVLVPNPQAARPVTAEETNRLVGPAMVW